MVVTLPEVQGCVELTNKHVISDELWNRLVNRIVKDENVERSLAVRVMDQALGFLQLVAAEPHKEYSPSPLVDIGWHTFILYTREYAAFCDMLKGSFIHHEPTDIEGIDYGTGHIRRTVQALRSRGLIVDDMLWDAAACCRECSTSSCR